MKQVSTLPLRWPTRISRNLVWNQLLVMNGHRVGYPKPVTFEQRTAPAEKNKPGNDRASNTSEASMIIDQGGFYAPA